MYSHYPLDPYAKLSDTKCFTLSIRWFCIQIERVMTVYGNYNVIAFRSCIQIFTVYVERIGYSFARIPTGKFLFSFLGTLLLFQGSCFRFRKLCFYFGNPVFITRLSLPAPSSNLYGIAVYIIDGPNSAY